ncbi:TetR/AcrR family transcriptional regulator [Actinophytocola sediminis]
MGMGQSAVAESGARLRTRRAILDAAVIALAANSAATLADIAVAANVGRTTVHRYFPERSDLLRAIGVDFLDKIDVATESARLDDGAAPDALSRLCQEYFEFGDLFTLFFGMPELATGPLWDEETASDRAVIRLIERGHAEGTIDREMAPTWVQQLVWSLLFTAWAHVRDNGAPKHQALSLCLRTLTKTLAP